MSLEMFDGRGSLVGWAIYRGLFRGGWGRPPMGEDRASVVGVAPSQISSKIRSFIMG